MASSSDVRAGRAYVELNVDDETAKGLEAARQRVGRFKTQTDAIGQQMAGNGGDAAKGWYSGWLKETNKLYGKRSDFAKTLKLLAGGGVIGGVSMALKGAQEFTHSLVEMKNGAMGLKDVLASIPIFGTGFKIGQDLRELVTGEKAIAEAAERFAKAQRDAYEATVKTNQEISKNLAEQNKKDHEGDDERRARNIAAVYGEAAAEKFRKQVALDDKLAAIDADAEKNKGLIPAGQSYQIWKANVDRINADAAARKQKARDDFQKDADTEAYDKISKMLPKDLMGTLGDVFNGAMGAANDVAATLTEQAKKDIKEKADADQQLRDEIDEAEAKATRDKYAEFEAQRAKALREAEKTGADPALIKRKFDLMRQAQEADDAAKGDKARAGTTRGTFNIAEAKSLSAGGGAWDRTAKATERTAKNTDGLKDEVDKIALPAFA